MAEAARTFIAPQEVATRLTLLGLSTAQIRAAVERGVAERRACTRFDPPSYPGIVQWARTHRALRESLVPLGWQASDAGNFSTVVSPDELSAITISTGNDRTGKLGLPSPSTKYAKGPET